MYPEWFISWNLFERLLCLNKSCLWITLWELKTKPCQTSGNNINIDIIDWLSSKYVYI